MSTLQFKSIKTVIFLPFSIVTIAVLSFTTSSIFVLTGTYDEVSNQLEKTVKIESFLTKLSNIRSEILYASIDTFHGYQHIQSLELTPISTVNSEHNFSTITIKNEFAYYALFLEQARDERSYKDPDVQHVIHQALIASQDGTNLINAVILGKQADELERLRLLWGSSEQQVDAVLADLFSVNNNLLHEEQKTLKKLQYVFMMGLLCILSIIVASFIFKLFIINKYILKPIEIFNKKVQNNVHHGLLEPINMTNLTEIGNLASEFDELMQRIRDNEKVMIEEVRVRTEAERATKDALEDLTRAKDQLVRSEKLAAIGTMVGGVAHEINNPLMGLNSYLDHLKDNLYEERDLILIEKAHKQINRIARIVKNMLVFSRTSEETPGTHSSCDTVLCVELVKELVESTFKKSFVTFKISPAVNIPNAAISDDHLQQILLNLFKNAIEALNSHPIANHEPTVWVDIKEVAQDIEIKVSDNGPGLNADAEKRLFEPFFTTKPPGVGTGLGLAVSLQLAEMAHGSLQFSPRPEGGAVFSLHIPKEKS